MPFSISGVVVRMGGRCTVCDSMISDCRGRCTKDCVQLSCCCAIFILLICIMPPLIMVYGTYEPQQVSFDPRATRLYTLENVWNQQVTLYAAQGNGAEAMDSFILRTRPPIAATKDQFTVNQTIDSDFKGYKYRAFYMVPPWRADVTVSAGDGFDFYLFTEGNYQLWASGDSNSVSAVKQYKYRPDHREVGQIVVYNRTSNQEGNFYFVVKPASGQGRKSNISIRMDVERSLYNLTKLSALTTCRLSNISSDDNCTSHLPYAGSTYALFIGPNSTHGDPDIWYSQKLRYVPRPSVYIATFGGLAAVFTAVWAYCYHKSNGTRRTPSSSGTPTECRRLGAGERSGSATQPSPPTYDAIAAKSPPKYEAVIAKTKPPSYNAALAAAASLSSSTSSLLGSATASAV